MSTTEAGPVRLIPSQPAPARSRLPFNIIDEAVHLLDNEQAPWSIQLEAEVTGQIDEDRLRGAVRVAINRHPMARARKLGSGRSDRRSWWEITEEADLDPVRALPCPDDEALARLRSELYSLSVPLAESPPLRVRLARRPPGDPAGDLVLLNVHHAASDGFGALRLMRSIARAYGEPDGQPDGQPELDLASVRDIGANVAGGSSARIRRRLELLEKLRDLARPPARIAAERPREAAGYGFHHVSLSPLSTKTLGALHPFTVNDILVAALHLAVEAWNDSHGAPCGRISTLVPSNLRPSERSTEIVGNFSLPVRLSTVPRERASATAATAALATRAGRRKVHGMGTALAHALSRSTSLSIGAKQAIAALLPATGNRLVDTAILSNLGRVDDVPSFGPDAGETVALWFSAPARMPLGLSVGATGAAGRLHLVFRSLHRLLDAEGARRFADCYLDTLDRLRSDLV